MAHIARFADLEVLDLGGTKVGDAGLARLAGLTRLHDLNLSGTRVSDAGLARVAKLTELRYLDLSGTGIGDAGLVHLAGLERLDALDLSGTKVGDAGMGRLKGMTSLRALDLSRTSVGDAGLDRLSDGDVLQGHLFLRMAGGRTTDAGRGRALRRFASRDRLNIITDDDGEKLRQRVSHLLSPIGRGIAAIRLLYISRRLHTLDGFGSRRLREAQVGSRALAGRGGGSRLPARPWARRRSGFRRGPVARRAGLGARRRRWRAIDAWSARRPGRGRNARLVVRRACRRPSLAPWGPSSRVRRRRGPAEFLRLVEITSSASARTSSS